MLEIKAQPGPVPSFAEPVRFLTFKQLQAFLALNERYLWSLISSSDDNLRIPSYKVGKRRLFRFDEIMWWAEKRRDE